MGFSFGVPENPGFFLGRNRLYAVDKLGTVCRKRKAPGLHLKKDCRAAAAVFFQVFISRCFGRNWRPNILPDKDLVP